MKRRELLRTLVVSGGVGLAGCSGFRAESPESDPREGGSETGTPSTVETPSPSATLRDTATPTNEPPPATPDGFGSAVALDGHAALVGAAEDANPNGERAGAAYLFERTTDGWKRDVTLVPDDGDTGDGFGAAVALSGDAALVGAPENEDPNGRDGGSAYLFERTDGTWTQRAKLAAGSGASVGAFGASVALEGDTALVGAPGDGYQDEGTPGAAYLFEEIDGDWSHGRRLTPGGSVSGDAFGHAVALSDGTALIGAPFDDEPNGEWGGSVYVLGGSEWSRWTKIAPKEGTERETFGCAVALSGGTALLGARGDAAIPGTVYAEGSAYVFTRMAGEWSQAARLTPPDGRDFGFGTAVAVDDDTALVGEFVISDVAGHYSTARAHVFERATGDWTHRSRFDHESDQRDDFFGRAVGLSGDAALVGAPDTDDYMGTEGSTHLFEREGGQWSRSLLFTADGVRTTPLPTSTPTPTRTLSTADCSDTPDDDLHFVAVADRTVAAGTTTTITGTFRNPLLHPVTNVEIVFDPPGEDWEIESLDTPLHRVESQGAEAIEFTVTAPVTASGEYDVELRVTTGFCSYTRTESVSVSVE
jgi:hypothetical protein